MESFKNEQNQQTVVPANYSTTNQTSDNNNELPGSSSSFADEFMRANADRIVHGEQGEIRLPLGFRFVPLDEEIIYILSRKIMKNPVKNSQLYDTKLYLDNPSTLTADRDPVVNNTWFFFTSRDKKYPNGSRPKRGIINSKGYWKATGKDKDIKYKNKIIGYRKALVFYEGDPPKGTKTHWIMHEYKVHPSLIRNRVRDDSSNNMLLDEWVLCKVYIKKQKKPRGGANGAEDNDNAEVDRRNQETLPTTGGNSNTNQPSPLQMANGDVLPNVSNAPATSTNPVQDSMPGTNDYPIPNSMPETNNYSLPNSMPRTSDYPIPNSMPETNNYPLSNNGLESRNYPMSNSIHETSNYPLPNNGFGTVNYPLPNIVPETGNYYLPNGFSHQSNTTSTLDPNATTDLNGCINGNSLQELQNLLETSNSLPVASADVEWQEYWQSMLGARNYPPPIPPANPQNGAHDQFMLGDNNSMPVPSNSPPQTRFPRQFVPGDHYNNVPINSNYPPPVPPANPQNGAYDQFMPGEHNNNMHGASNSPPQTGLPHRFVPGVHYNNVPVNSNYPLDDFSLPPPTWKTEVPHTEFVPGGFTEMLLGSNNYSQNLALLDDIDDFINNLADYPIDDELLHSVDLSENQDGNNLSREENSNLGESSGPDQ